MSNEEWKERMERFRYNDSLPWERWVINRLRRRKGKPPLR